MVVSPIIQGVFYAPVYCPPNLIKKPAVIHSLLTAFQAIPDHRSDQGRRFDLAYLISLVLLGFIKGKTSIEACVEFGRARKRWFSNWFDTTHGVPDATTISRALAVTSAQDLIQAVNRFTRMVDGTLIEVGVSLDGKTIKAISELKSGVRHFISLFSHTTCGKISPQLKPTNSSAITGISRTNSIGRKMSPGEKTGRGRKQVAPLAS